ncbi:MAG TPA: PAS domain-containing protein [Gaiella sp.]|jgi:PAS domain S-box-containing protein|nr:PAS domain-containing protein [Gaiella sp.]
MTAPPTDERLDRPATSDSTARALVAAIPDPIFRIGVDGIYRGFKVDSEEDLLTPADEVIGYSVNERLPVGVAEAVLAAGRRAVEEQEPQHIEYSLEVRGAVHDYEGRVVACGPDEFVLIVRDFTERTRQERELQRERDFSRAVVRSTPSFLALVDTDGTLLGVNRALERAAGIPEESWLGLPFWKKFIAEHDVERAQHDFRRLADGDPPGVVEYEHVGPEGERLVVDWTATIVHDAEGAVRYLLCGLDVTARKQVEEEIRRSRARIVSAGDAERKRLERNLHDGAQQNLVSVSHAVHLAMRQLRTDPDKAEEHLDRALEDLTTAHEELRELARGLHPQLLTLQGLGAAVRALARRASIPVTVITVDDAERWPPLVESAAYFVVSEALTNVLKYARASSATVRVAPRDDVLVIEVSDDGCGGAKPEAGSGLGGLRDRVEALDGVFELDSPAGAGTRVRAELPLAVEP